MTIPFISIVVPTYQSSTFIKDMLDSLYGQSFQDFEVIISDGASMDDTVEIVRRSGLSNLVIESRPDEGVPDALNRGFALARGQVLCWLNSDDVYVSHEVLEKVARAFRTRRPAFAYGHTVLADPEGCVTWELYAHIPRPGFEHHGINLTTGSLFFTREAWGKFGGFSGRHKYGFEYELKKFLFATSSRPLLIDSFVSALRIHPDTLSSVQTELIDRERAEILTSVREVPRWVKLLERKSSQALQGTLLPSIRARYASRRVGRHWRDLYAEKSA